MIELSFLPALPLEDRDRFPHVAAVYFLLDGANRPLYIGRAVNVFTRWAAHRNGISSFLRDTPGVRVAWLRVPNSELAETELQMIEYYDPPFNWIGGVAYSMIRQGLSVTRNRRGYSDLYRSNTDWRRMADGYRQTPDPLVVEIVMNYRWSAQW